MAAKKTTFNPAAVDADGDGLVQDGTEFERAVDAVSAVEASECADGCDDCDCEPEAAVEATSAPVVASEGTYVCADGDSYAGIAARHVPAGLTKHEYAMHLYNINAGKALAAGVEVKL